MAMGVRSALLIGSDLLYYAARFFVLELPRYLLGSRRRLLEDPAKRVQALKVKGDEKTPVVVEGAPWMAVIIPCLNEAKNVEKAVKSAGGAAAVEVVVVDGGSTDGSQEVCAELGVRVVEGGLFGCRCRADALNVGAQVTSAPVLLFLHADTTLPTGYMEEVRVVLSRDPWAVGAFALSFGMEGGRPGPLLRLICWAANVRSRWLHMPYGDQALFMRRDVFEALGRFVPQPLMEDVDLVALAGRLGMPIRTSDRLSVCTSARRWEWYGTLANTGLNQLVLLGRALGVPVARLALWYRGFPPKA